MLKEAASLDDYSATAALRKRRWEEPPTSAPVSLPQQPNFGTTYTQPQQTYSLPISPNSILSPTQVARSNPSSPSHHQISMAHSMAISPVASMSGPASIFPLTQGPGALITTPMQSPPVYPYNSAPNLLAANWDLGNLLMMQMGYSQYEPNMQFNVGQGLASQQAPGATGTIVQPLAQSSGAQENASASPESFGNAEDLLSLFSDIPMAFRYV